MIEVVVILLALIGLMVLVDGPWCRLAHRSHYGEPQVMHTHSETESGSAGYKGRFCERCQVMRRPLSRFAPKPGIRV